MNRSRNGRSHYSPEKRAALLSEFGASGETQKAFAQRRGIRWTTFRNWLYARRSKTPAKAPISLQEISIGPLLGGNEWIAEIALSGGTVVRLKAGADPAWATAIIQPLFRPC